MVLELLTGLVVTFGYLGIFIASLIGSASILFPVPIFVAVIAAGAFLNPVLVGIAAGAGSAIGEMTSYLLGLAGEKITIHEKKMWKKYFVLAEKWFERHGGFAVIFIFAVTPLPFDIVGLFCGAIKYNIKKFFIANLIGKIIKNIILALVGFYGIGFLAGFLGF
jgi:membrane protein DedA with SNARE-associated domain